jgi:hypothetical protein
MIFVLGGLVAGPAQCAKDRAALGPAGTKVVFEKRLPNGSMLRGSKKTIKHLESFPKNVTSDGTSEEKRTVTVTDGIYSLELVGRDNAKPELLWRKEMRTSDEVDRFFMIDAGHGYDVHILDAAVDKGTAKVLYRSGIFIYLDIALKDGESGWKVQKTLEISREVSGIGRIVTAGEILPNGNARIVFLIRTVEEWSVTGDKPKLVKSEGPN